MGKNLTRREFIKNSSLITATIGVGITLGGFGCASKKIESPIVEQTEAMPESPLQYQTLGRTGLNVSKVSFGGIQIQDPALLEAAIEKGINLIHTSPGYGKGRSIKIFGEVMKTKRDKVFLALKKSPIGGIDNELRILNTDHVDILMPPLHTLKDIQNPGLPGAYDKLKQEGKIRFSGFSCHKEVAAVMAEAVDLGYFDAMLIAYNLTNRDELDPVLQKVKEKDIGFMAMKTMRGLNQNNPEVVAAGHKKLLSNPNVDTLLIGTASYEDLEKNLAMLSSGLEVSMREETLLAPYIAVAQKLCNSCGACDKACPENVCITDIMRCKMYDERGERNLAVDTYRDIPVNSTVANCTDCGKCEQACPRDIAIRQTLLTTHSLLA